MEVYAVTFLLSLFFCLLSVWDTGGHCFRKKPKPAFFVASAVVLIVVLGFREGVGTDYYDVYTIGFLDIASGEVSRFEPGFTIIVQVLAFLGFDYHALFFVMATATVGLVYLAIYRQSPRPLWSVVIFILGGFFFFSTNGIRQALAVAILLNAVPYATKGSLFKYTILVIFATTIHSFSVVFLLFYFLRDFKLGDIRLILLLTVIAVFSSMLASAFLGLAASVSDQIARYTNSEALTAQYLTGDIDFSDLIMCGLPLVAYYLSSGIVKRTPLGTETNYLFVFLFAGVISCVLSGSVSIFSRVAAYFTPFLILAVPSLFQCLEEAKFQYLWVLEAFFALFLIASCVYLYAFLNFSSVLPYASVFGAVL